MNICPLCKDKHNKNHKFEFFDKKNYICDKHYDSYTKFCIKCKENLCMICEKDHKDHGMIYLGDIIPNKENITKRINELRKYIDKLEKDLNELLKIINNVKINIELFFKIYNDLNNNYEIKYKNYQILKNISEFDNYSNDIINDIKKVIYEKNIFNKVNNLINIFYKMNYKSQKNNSYFNKVNYIFNKEPQNLKYKLDITNNNDSSGINDIFEVFISYKDNQEYLVSKNIKSNNLDIFKLSDNKKLISLKGHNNTIRTIRYFINNNDCCEYLISGDDNFIVIIWDIINNYNIKYKIETNYKSFIYSCLLFFPDNNNNNYIITSSYNISDTLDESATKIYSFNNCEFKKYIQKSNQYNILYLLYWKNKLDNNYYLIELTENNAIRINNLLTDDLYCELKHEKELEYYCGFIYNQYYLCTSSTGYINLWNLYHKNAIKTIQTDMTSLNYIIEWNEKYFISADFGNFVYKILDSKLNIISFPIQKVHSDAVK